MSYIVVFFILGSLVLILSKTMKMRLIYDEITKRVVINIYTLNSLMFYKIKLRVMEQMNYSVNNKQYESIFNSTDGMSVRIKDIFDSIHIKHLNIEIYYGSNEAYPTAFRAYGAQLLLDNVLKILQSVNKVKSYHITTLPSYETQRLNINADFRVNIKTISMLKAFIKSPIIKSKREGEQQ